MNKPWKKISGITLGILFMIFLALVPTILIQTTVQSVKLAVKVKDLPKTLSKRQPPIASIVPIEKEMFFHFLPGASTYALESIDQDLTCSNCRGKKGQALPPARTPAQVIGEAIDAQTSIIALTCSDAAASCDYTLNTAKLAKQNNFSTVLSYDGCLNASTLKKILPSFDAVKIELGSRENNYCQTADGSPLAAALTNLKAVKDSGKYLEISYLLSPANSSSTQISLFLDSLKAGAGLDTPLHFASAGIGEEAARSETISAAAALARQAGFKYVYADEISLPDGENTYCADGSVALMRQGDFLIKDNTKNGVCADGTAILGVWEKK